MKDLRIKIMAMRLEVKEDLTEHSDWLCGQNKKITHTMFYVDNRDKSDINQKQDKHVQKWEAGEFINLC